MFILPEAKTCNSLFIGQGPALVNDRDGKSR